MHYYTPHNPIDHNWCIALRFHNTRLRIECSRLCCKRCTPPTSNCTTGIGHCSGSSQTDIGGRPSCRMSHRMQHTPGKHQNPSNSPTRISSNRSHCRSNSPPCQSTRSMRQHSDSTHSNNSGRWPMTSTGSSLTWMSHTMCMWLHSNGTHPNNSHILMYSNRCCTHPCAGGTSRRCWR